MAINLFQNHVTDLDYARLDEHNGLVGESCRVGVTFTGMTDKEGILYDFSHAKKKVKSIIDECCDHRLIVPDNSVRIKEDHVAVDYEFGLKQRLSYKAPEQAVCLLPTSHTGKENVQTFLESIILPQMPKNIVAVKIHLIEEELSHPKAVFHYTHGLKTHYGNCQRLFHGHRNTVQVEVNGNNRDDLARWLAEDVFRMNTHFCFFDNVVNSDEVKEIANDPNPEGVFENLASVKIRYQAIQGEFEATLPGSMVYISPG